jgi:hypothetical protein
MDLFEFMSEISEAEYVKYYPDTELFYVWRGGMGVNIYFSHTGKEVDYFTMGTQPDGVDDVSDSIDSHNDAILYEEEDY